MQSHQSKSGPDPMIQWTPLDLSSPSQRFTMLFLKMLSLDIKLPPLDSTLGFICLLPPSPAFYPDGRFLRLEHAFLARPSHFNQRLRFPRAVRFSSLSPGSIYPESFCTFMLIPAVVQILELNLQMSIWHSSTAQKSAKSQRYQVGVHKKKKKKKVPLEVFASGLGLFQNRVKE